MWRRCDAARVEGRPIAIARRPAQNTGARQLTDTCFVWAVLLDPVLCGLQLAVQGPSCWTSPPLQHLTALSKKVSVLQLKGL